MSGNSSAQLNLGARHLKKRCGVLFFISEAIFEMVYKADT